MGVCSGNLVRNLRKEGPYTPDPPGWGTGISVEADTSVTGNVIENAPRFGITLGWGKFLRNVIANANVIRQADVGIAVSVVEGVGAAVITDNLIDGAKSGGIVGYRWTDAATDDLSQITARRGQSDRRAQSRQLKRRCQAAARPPPIRASSSGGGAPDSVSSDDSAVSVLQQLCQHRRHRDLGRAPCPVAAFQRDAQAQFRDRGAVHAFRAALGEDAALPQAPSAWCRPVSCRQRRTGFSCRPPSAASRRRRGPAESPSPVAMRAKPSARLFSGTA